METIIETDVLVIGSGIAGGVCALQLADSGLNVCLVTRAKELFDTNTNLAQGGIVYRGLGDSPELFIQDAMRASSNQASIKALSILAEEGPALVRSILIDRLQIVFDQTNHELSFANEASHSVPRVLHAKDATGREITGALVKALKAHPKIRIETEHTAIDLLTPSHHSQNAQLKYGNHMCVGVYLFNQKTNKVVRCFSKKTVLATGGVGQVYLRSTNPVGARGDGLAMAYRAGARIMNMEYIQFHPTTFFKKGANPFLISEALRGAGARLVHEDGTPFMEKYDAQWKDLAPRDVVSRSIYQEMLTSSVTHVYLDAKSYVSKTDLEEKFPNILEACFKEGVDPRYDLIPVVPGAHYACGGVWVNGWGQSSIQNLYAVGEVSCTGVHGANRLASTSLLEGLVWGKRAAQQIQKEVNHQPQKFQPIISEIPAWQDFGHESPDPVLIKQDQDLIQSTMWNYVGLIRTPQRLKRAFRDLRNLEYDIETFYNETQLSDELIGLRNMVKVSVIITTAALKNKQSVGCHTLG